jgi:hypothetical protein
MPTADTLGLDQGRYSNVGRTFTNLSLAGSHVRARNLNDARATFSTTVRFGGRLSTVRLPTVTLSTVGGFLVVWSFRFGVAE